MDNADDQNEDREDEGKGDKDSNENKGDQESDLVISTGTEVAQTGKVAPNSEPEEFIGDEHTKTDEEVFTDEPLIGAAG